MLFLRRESGNLTHLKRCAAFIEMFRRNVHIIVPNDCAACCLCTQEKRETFEWGKDRLFEEGTRVIDTLCAAREGDKQGIVLSCLHILNNPYRLVHDSAPFSSAVGQSCKAAAHSSQAPS